MRPKTQLQEMTVEVDPGNPKSGRTQERRNDPARADRAEHQLRPVPRRARRRHPRLPAAADHRRGRRPETQRREPRGDLQALRPAGAPRRRDHARTAALPREHRESIHNFRLIMEALGRQGHAARRTRRRRRTRIFRVFANEDTNVEAHRTNCPGALEAQTSSGLQQGRDGIVARPPDAHEAPPVRKSLARGPARERQAPADDDADHRERNPPVRARNPRPWSAKFTPATATFRRRCPSSR